MKLARHSRTGFQYQLSEEEAHALRILINQFPIGEPSPIKISKTDSKAAEREKLLNESLAGHRNELKSMVGNLMDEDKFKKSKRHLLFHVNLEGRETLLQILNDIRIECWRFLGEPENLDMEVSELPKEKIKHYHFMHLAGYFEHHFLNPEEPDGK
jgi:hypothetical protein